MPTYFPIAVPQFQAVDADGNPVSGGWLQSYIAGTSTPTPLYSNSTGTLLANPNQLDGGGCKTIYGDPDVIYKLVIARDEDLTQIVRTIDQVVVFTNVFAPLGDIQIGNGSLTDTNSNRYIKFLTASSAANYLTYSNAASGSNPSFTVTGSGNVGLDLTMLGSGALALTGKQTISGTLNVTGTTTVGTINSTTLTATTATLTTTTLSTTSTINGALTLNATSGSVSLTGQTSFAFSGSSTATFTSTELDVKNTNSSNPGLLKIFEPTGTGTTYIGVTTPSTVASSYTIKLPTTQGTAGQYPASDGNNPVQLTWTTPGLDQFQNIQSYTTPGTYTFTTSSTTTVIYVKIWGAGGGGGGGIPASTCGGGGGSGGYIEAYYTVTPSTGYTVVVGAVGTAGTTSSGGAGGQSYINSAATIQASGGAGGITGVSGGGGAGGATTSNLSATKYFGQSGQAGQANTNTTSGTFVFGGASFGYSITMGSLGASPMPACGGQGSASGGNAGGAGQVLIYY